MMTHPYRHILDGLRVLDFSQMLAGPTATRMMAEMGAEVIKVELPPEGDRSRLLPFIKGGRSGYFIQQNRGKKSICVDLKSELGRQAVFQLLPTVDVVVESFSPGVIERLGFGYEAVKSANPQIVMCSISAFGQEGPLADLPGYDNIAQAYAGVTSMIGEPDLPPALTSVGLGDVMTGVHGLAAIVSALFFRLRTGEGQWVQASLLDSYFHCHEINVQTVSGSAGMVQPTRSGSHHYAVTPFGIFRSHGSDILIGVVSEGEWPRLCRAMGRPDMANDPQLGSNALRCQARDRVISAIQQWLDNLDNIEQALEALGAARVPCAPVLSVTQAMSHPHIRCRGTVRTVPDPVWGSIDIPGFPLRFSLFPETMALEAPGLGQHNAEVLVPIVGLKEFRHFEEEKIVISEDSADALGSGGYG